MKNVFWFNAGFCAAAINKERNRKDIMPSLYQLKDLMCEIGSRVWKQGWVAANDGNFSCRLTDDEYLVTPTGVSKGFMDPGMLIVVDGEGNKKFGSLRPSSEIKMHLEVYRKRPDIGGIIHAHPATATGFAVAGIPLNECILPEVVVTIGGAPIVPYGTPSTDELAQSFVPYLEKADAFLLANHGALTLGSDLMSAFYRMESLEHFAKILLVARQLGKVNFLTEQQVCELNDLRKKFGIQGNQYPCESCSTNTK